MSKPQDFAQCLHRYFQSYLSNCRNVSQNTLKSYSYTFKLFFIYMEQKYKLPPHKISFQAFTSQNIESFLEWIEYERHCSIATRNQRLATIHSFCRFVEMEYPECLINVQNILKIKLKKAPEREMNYLSHDAMKLLLAQPNLKNEHEFRDLVLLTMLYDLGARVSEITEIKTSDLFLQSPPSVRLHGKGNKFRQVPLMPETAKLLKKYLIIRKSIVTASEYLFLNPSGRQLSRGGITYILQKYGDRARNVTPSLIPEYLSPHCLRHSKAMHLLRSGVNLVYIRDFLGHTDVKTTEIYAKADPEMKRDALEKAYSEVAPSVTDDWCDDVDLMHWISSF